MGFTHLSTGDLLRNEVKQETERAAAVKEIMEAGGLVPVETTLDILKDAVESALATGGGNKLLIDGFPREMEQVGAFVKKVCRHESRGGVGVWGGGGGGQRRGKEKNARCKVGAKSF
jgi:adenylate kinase family enzyme